VIAHATANAAVGAWMVHKDAWQFW